MGAVALQGFQNRPVLPHEKRGKSTHEEKQLLILVSLIALAGGGLFTLEKIDQNVRDAVAREMPPAPLVHSFSR